MALSTCLTTHAPWHRHASAPHISNIIKRRWKKFSKIQGCTTWLQESWTHTNPSFCPHPLSPNLKMLPSYKTLKFCVSLIQRTLTFFRATKETCSWLLFSLNSPLTILSKVSLLLCPFPLIGNIERDRSGLAEIWTCDSRHWLHARGPWYGGPASQSPCFWPQSFYCFFWCRMKVPVIYLSKRLAESQPVIMVNKTCWSYYGEERSNYNGFKQY